MTVTLTHDMNLSRVQIDASALDLAATTAIVERSTDQIKWITVRAGTDVVVSSGAFAVAVSDYEFAANVENFYRVTPGAGAAETNSITPVLEQVWLKSIARPFLNMSFPRAEIVGSPDADPRNTIHEVIGRTLPVALTDVGGSPRYPVRVDTDTNSKARNLRRLLQSGDILFLHVTPDWPLESAYVVHLSAPQTMRWTTEWSTWDINLHEVAAPGADVIGSTSTYQTVLNTYADYNEALLAHTDYGDVLTLIGDPNEVIVP